MQDWLRLTLHMNAARITLQNVFAMMW